MPSHSAAERQALADALTEAGPGAPTLCTGWTTTDLAVHLVMREGLPHVRVAGAIGPLKGWAKGKQQALAARPFTDLVATIRNGPPRHSPFALPGADERANLMEHFVHCEDVRRAGEQWQPRALPAERQAAFWKTLTSPFGKVLLRRSKVPVSLQVPGGEPVAVTHTGDSTGVVIVGDPGELAVYLFGRTESAKVEILGREEAVLRFKDSELNL
jgi:uncharacterized protein (TIGR03085 family)